MKIYQIRHKPTGLFFRPTKKIYNHRPDSLVKTGKIYYKIPNIAQFLQADKKTGDIKLWRGGTFPAYYNVDKEFGHYDTFHISEFEIVEYDLLVDE